MTHFRNMTTQNKIYTILGWTIIAFIILAFAFLVPRIPAQTPSHCSGTTHQICDCMGWPWDEKTKSCPEPKWPQSATASQLPEYVLREPLDKAVQDYLNLINHAIDVYGDKLIELHKQVKALEARVEALEERNEKCLCVSTQPPLRSPKPDQTEIILVASGVDVKAIIDSAAPNDILWTSPALEQTKPTLDCDVNMGEWLTADGRCHEWIVETRKVPVTCATTYKHDSTGYHAVITCSWRVK